MPAVFDDSLVSKGGVFFYAHAIVSDTHLPQTLLFKGSNSDIYTHEDEIVDLIKQHPDIEIYACEHYRTRYTRIAAHVAGFVNRRSRLPKALHTLHVRADELARRTAQQGLEAEVENLFIVRGDP